MKEALKNKQLSVHQLSKNQTIEKNLISQFNVRP